jgi:uncharacterized membrane protein SpoIIM required for sporulation
VSELRLKSVEFRRDREASWRELEAVLEAAEGRGVSRLDFRQLSRLPVLYRAVLSSLSVARAISLDRNVTGYLEGLAGRAYIAVYGVRRPLGVALAGFLARRFPGELRAHRWYLAVAAAMFVLGVASGFVMTSRDIDAYYRLVPAELAQERSPTSSVEELRDVLLGPGSLAGGLNMFASFLFRHNSQVGILCFVLGFAAGLPVFYLLFTNGLVLGALASLHHQRGLGLAFWGWVLPHGVTELTAVVICGAAGLVVARALLVPGPHGRLYDLAVAGRRAGILVLGAVVMLFVAAGFEGYFRQLVHDTPIRLLTAAAMSVVWCLYFGFAGRERP